MPGPVPTRAIATAAVLVGALAAALTGCSPGEPAAEEPAIAVRTEILARHDLRPALTLLGTLVDAERRPLQAPVAGTLTYPRRFAQGLATGASVRAGEVLATLVSLPSRERLSEAQLAQRAAEQELERIRRGADLGVLPHADLERAEMQAETARLRARNAAADAARLELRAPAAGVLLVDRVVAPGSEIAAGETLAELAIGDGLRVEAAAAAGDQVRLAPGLAARVLSADGQRQLASATVREVASTLAGGTLRVVAELAAEPSADPTESSADHRPQSPGALPPAGSGVLLEVLLAQRTGVLTVPEEAVVTGAGSAAVWLVAGGAERPRAARRVVRLGTRGAGRVEVLEGLAPGDRVAVSGVALLQPGTVVVERADGAGGGS